MPTSHSTECSRPPEPTQRATSRSWTATVMEKQLFKTLKTSAISISHPKFDPNSSLFQFAKKKVNATKIHFRWKQLQKGLRNMCRKELCFLCINQSNMALNKFDMILRQSQLTMGSILALCYLPIPNQGLTLTLLAGISKIGLNLSQAEIYDVNKLVASSQNKTIDLEEYTIQYQRVQGHANLQHSFFPETTRLTARPKHSNKAVVVNQWGYYVGQLSKGKPHDTNGEMFFINLPKEMGEQQFVRLIIRGEWRNGDIVQGKGFSATNAQLFTVKWNNPLRNISLEFVEGEIRSYNGQIVLYLSQRLNRIIEGKATIIFRDGSLYKGRIINGLMETNPPEPALFVSADGNEHYLGGFKGGKRHGSSLIIANVQNIQSAFKMDWENGIPNINTFVFQPRASVIERIQKTKNS